MVKPNISARIRDARKLAGLTQEDLATATGLPQPEISKLERGLRRVYADDLMLIAQATGVSAAWLLEPDEQIRRGVAALTDREPADGEWLIETGLSIIRQNRA